MTTLMNKFSNCFLNSVIQLITLSEDIMESFVVKIEGDEPSDKEKEKILAIKPMIDFFDLYRKGGIVNPIELLKYYKTLNPGLVYGRQEDARDTLTYFLDQAFDKSQFQLQIEQRVYNKKFPNVKEEDITREMILNGSCEYEISPKVTPETVLTVPINEDISESIKEYFAEVDEDIYEIEKEINTEIPCIVNGIEDTSIVEVIRKKIKILRSSPKIEYNPGNTPNFLFMSLKRFDFELNKDDREVNICDGIMYGGKHYNVIGYIIHTGIVGSGHYTTVRMERGEWFLYNDTKRDKLKDLNGCLLQTDAYIFLLVLDELYGSFSTKEDGTTIKTNFYDEIKESIEKSKIPKVILPLRQPFDQTGLFDIPNAPRSNNDPFSFQKAIEDQLATMSSGEDEWRIPGFKDNRNHDYFDGKLRIKDANGDMIALDPKISLNEGVFGLNFGIVQNEKENISKTIDLYPKSNGQKRLIKNFESGELWIEMDKREIRTILGDAEYLKYMREYLKDEMGIIEDDGEKFDIYSLTDHEMFQYIDDYYHDQKPIVIDGDDELLTDMEIEDEKDGEDEFRIIYPHNRSTNQYFTHNMNPIFPPSQPVGNLGLFSGGIIDLTDDKI